MRSPRACRGILGDILEREAERVHRRDLHGDVAGELLEGIGAGDEVGLALELDEGADAALAVDVGLDDAFAGLAIRALGRAGHALLTDQLAGGVEVAAGLFEGAFGVHDAGAGLFTELLDVAGGNHGDSSLLGGGLV